MGKYILLCVLVLTDFCQNTIAAVAIATETNPNARQVYNVAVEADDIASRVLFDAASDEFNFDVSYQLMDSFDSLLDSVENGTADFAANVTYTPEREKRFDFSRPTNIEYTYLFTAKGESIERMRKVAIPEDTIYGELVQEHYPGIEQVAYSNGVNAINLLKNGRVDGVIDAINQLKPMLRAGFQATLLNDVLPIQPVSIISTKGKYPKLLKQLETYAHRPESQALLSDTISKYQLNIRINALRKEVRDSGIDIQKTFLVKLENIGKYAIYRSGSAVSGISADVIFKSCDVLMIKCGLVSHADENWSNMYNDLINNRIDILSPTVKSVPRKSKMYFSDAYYRPAAEMVKREGYKTNVYNNVSELLVEKIGVVKDDFYQELMEHLLPKTELTVYPDQGQLLDGLLNGEVDYIVLTHARFNQVLKDSGSALPIEEDKQIGEFYHSDVSIAFPKTEEGKQLAALFTKALTLINPESIINKYEELPDWHATLVEEKRINQQGMLLFSAILLGLIGVVSYLHFQSNTDGLTKLRNRRSLYRRFVRGVSPKTTIVYLDVNNFKEINDSYGHDTGDKVLKQLADKIDRYWTGRSYRIGGDEFILAGSVSQAQLNEILPVLNHFVYVDLAKGISFNVTVSVGVSPGRKNAASLENVLHVADVEMYKVKHLARAKLIAITPSRDDAITGNYVERVAND